MSDAEGIRRRRLLGPAPWRPDPDNIWLADALRDVDPESIARLDPALSAQLEARVRGLTTTVSVVMATWNRAHTIERAIDSVLGQSYAAHEVVVVDDGSTDDTLELLHARYADEIARGLVKIVAADHQGVCASRNLAVSRARGEVITYLDSDNVWAPEYLAMVVSVFDDDRSVATAYFGLESFLNGVPDFVRASTYDRSSLLRSNFIDLNAFSHRRFVYGQLGGFDEGLTRLVDWDLVLRYTARYPPVFIPVLAIDYHLDEAALGNITFSESFGDNYAKVAAKHAGERIQHGVDALRIGYVAWDYPALSQTFFHREVQLLVDAGHDVIVYWHAIPDAVADIDPRVRAFEVRDAEHLGELLVEHQRNVCHSHFIYPATTLLTFPACVAAGVRFTFMPHAVDLFQHDNRRRNRLAEVANHPLCSRVFVYGDHHADFLIDHGVDPHKISYMFQAVDFAIDPVIDQRTELEFADPPVGLVVARFIEKKGLAYLLDAIASMDPDEIAIKVVGYGPLEPELRSQATRLGLYNVTFCGPIRSESELLQLYDSVDFLVVPSVVAANGDMDGFPTVILEAMSVGLPVVTTDVSAVPDYLSDEVEAIVTPAADAVALADGLRRLLAMTAHERATLTWNAARFVSSRVGTLATIEQLLDEWQHYTIDIVLVTFDREGYRSIQETVELVRRVRALTTTRYRLIIVDNQSDEVFLRALDNAITGLDDVTLIELSDNVMCGPASNVALRVGSSELAIYLCSKEAFPLVRGWERAFLKHFRDNPESVLAGQPAIMPRCSTGAQYASREDFPRYRNPDFALEHPDRTFRHVQGGFYAVDRQFVAASGGFNDLIPHGGMDIEYSYFVESLGIALGEISEVVSLTTKTLPRVTAHLDASSVAVHPMTCDELERTSHLRDRHARSCNACGWVGDARTSPAARHLRSYGCPMCGSSALTRLLYRRLAMDPRVHIGFPMHVVSFDESIQRILGKQMFSVRTVGPVPGVIERLEELLAAAPAIVVIDDADVGPTPAGRIVDVCLRASQPGGMMIVPMGLIGTIDESPRIASIEELTCADRVVQFGLRRWGKVEIA